MGILRTEYKSIMRSDALKKAQEKYQEKVTRVNLNFYPNADDEELLEHLLTKPSKQGYIKDLIRADMKKEKDTH
jgi:hypothetical protein